MKFSKQVSFQNKLFLSSFLTGVENGDVTKTTTITTGVMIF